MRERRIIIYIAAKAGQGQSAVDVLEGTKQCGACGGAARITKQVVLVWGGATWGWHCNVRWSCSRHDMVHTATGHGVVSSGLVASLFWGIPRTGDGKSDNQTHLRARPSQTDQPAKAPRAILCPATRAFATVGLPAVRCPSCTIRLPPIPV